MEIEGREAGEERISPTSYSGPEALLFATLGLSLSQMFSLFQSTSIATQEKAVGSIPHPSGCGCPHESSHQWLQFACGNQQAGNAAPGSCGEGKEGRAQASGFDFRSPAVSPAHGRPFPITWEGGRWKAGAVHTLQHPCCSFPVSE
jgi:hypothetical protein